MTAEVLSWDGEGVDVTAGVTNFQLTFLSGLPLAEPPSCLKLASVRPRVSLAGMPGGLPPSGQPC